jgi:hypothetical protein
MNTDADSMRGQVRKIELDASDWRTVIDFYEALLSALGAPERHGMNVNALIDSMVWGGINELEPPYAINVTDARNLPSDVKEALIQAIEAIRFGRADHRHRRGHDVNVDLTADL